MSVDAGTAVVDVRADASGFGRSLGSQISKETSGIAGSLANVGKAAVAGIAIGAVAVGVFAKQSIDAARESIKVSAQTEAVIKSTGGAAGVTSKHIGDYAHELQNLSGVSDENIQSGANMLLTFTNIRNGVGATNQIFDQATATALDMSVALGQDTAQSALQLGKALNDPVKGVTALQRVGVQFTDQQKEQIKTLVESGDVMGAQKVILAELNKEFGGSAKAAGDALDPMQRLSIAWGDMQEQVGTFLIPILGRLATFITAAVLPALVRAGRVVSEFLKALFTGQSENEGTAVERFAFAVRDVVLPAFEKVSAFVTSTLVPAFRALGSFIAANLQPVLVGLGVALGVVTVAFVALAVAEIAAAAVPLLIVAGIAALVAAVVYAYTHFEALRVVVQAVATFFTTVFIPAVQAVASFVQQQLGETIVWVQTNWPQISEAITHVMNVIQMVIESALAQAKLFWQLFGDDITRFTKAVWPAIQQTIEGVMQAIRAIVLTITALINGDWGRAWDALKGLNVANWNIMRGVTDAGMAAIRGLIGAALSLVGALWSDAWRSFTGAVGAAFAEIRGAVSSGLNAVNDLLGGFPGRIVGAVGNLGSVLFNAGADLVRGFIRGIESVAGGIAGAITSKIPGGGLVGKFLGRASGGPVAARNPYIVGEVGPELFVPKTAGFVLPSNITSALASSGGSSSPVSNDIRIYVDGSGDPEATAEAVYQKLNRKLRVH